jgi:hypothetical protein
VNPTHTKFARLACPFLVAIALGQPLCLRAQANVMGDSIKTVGGTLSVKAVDGSKELRLRGKKLPGIGADHVAIKGKFSIAGNDVVLVEDNCLGSACTISSLHFVTVTPQGKTSLSPAIELPEGEEPQVVADDLKITLTTTVFQGRKRRTETWVYANGTVTKGSLP